MPVVGKQLTNELLKMSLYMETTRNEHIRKRRPLKSRNEEIREGLGEHQIKDEMVYDRKPWRLSLGKQRTVYMIHTHCNI